MSKVQTVCGAWLPTYDHEWVRDGSDVADPLWWLLDLAESDGREIKAYRVRPPLSSVDVALYVEDLWERFGEMLAKDGQLAGDNIAGLTRWPDLSERGVELLTGVIRKAIRDSVGVKANAWPMTGERVTVLPDEWTVNGAWVTVPLNERIVLEVEQ